MTIGVTKWTGAIAASIVIHLALVAGLQPRSVGEAARSAGAPVSVAGSLAGVLGAAANPTAANDETTQPLEPIEQTVETPATREANPSAELMPANLADEPPPPQQPGPAVKITAPAVRSSAAPEIAAPVREDAEPIEAIRPAAQERARERKVTPSPKLERTKPTATKKAARKPQSRRLTSSRASKAGTGRQGAAGAHRGGSGGAQVASAGSIRSYAASVRARILANRPGSVGRGRVVVAFALSTAGALRHVRIVGSSGSAQVDQAALGAVRRSSPFPRPPAGASGSQLQFSISFTFQ